MGKSSSLRRIEDTTTWERFTASVSKIGHMISSRVSFAGNLAVFSLSTLFWLVAKGPRRETLTHCFYFIGVLSIPVVMLTGTFIGMVLAVQAFPQFKVVGLETHIGAAINLSLVKELGPVLAATMLAGRVGSAIAAELGTMRVTEQIDALASMGVNPIHYLVVPRFISCLILIPGLTLFADLLGVVGGAFFSIKLLNVDWSYYWEWSRNAVTLFDIFAGMFKTLFFGAAIALICCHQGFRCGAGAEGVGRAATSSFVVSFVSILFLDLLLDVFLDQAQLWLTGARGGAVV
ncbi:MAG: ABC transporter permease [Thermoguttaceae bacterium]|nr:ABC transporter permease [Thermoguttaceae bacterium]MBR5758582.1 ABC transporter permease [Thermoguttaceae bacterium]